ncbi:hypothetical protein [Demequina aurantiaca]
MASGGSSYRWNVRDALTLADAAQYSTWRRAIGAENSFASGSLEGVVA